MVKNRQISIDKPILSIFFPCPMPKNKVIEMELKRISNLSKGQTS